MRRSIWILLVWMLGAAGYGMTASAVSSAVLSANTPQVILSAHRNSDSIAVYDNRTPSLSAVRIRGISPNGGPGVSDNPLSWQGRLWASSELTTYYLPIETVGYWYIVPRLRPSSASSSPRDPPLR